MLHYANIWRRLSLRILQYRDLFQRLQYAIYWDMTHRRVIRDDFPNRDVGYPSTVLLPDGRVLALYYFSMFDRFFIAGSAFTWERP